MRSLEYLLQLFPDKTGKELLQIQELDKLEDKQEFERRHRSKLDIIEDITNNGGYYKGRFGAAQAFYYSFNNLHLIEGQIYCDCNTVTCFFEPERVHIEQRTESFKQFENYGVSIYTRITKEEFESLLTYLKTTETLFW